MRHLVLAVLLIAGPALADVAKLRITPPAKCSDEAPITECPVTGYIVQRRDVGGIWREVGRAPATQLTWQQTVTTPAEYCYRVLAESNGVNSEPSNELCYTVLPKSPAAPTIEKIT